MRILSVFMLLFSVCCFSQKYRLNEKQSEKYEKSGASKIELSQTIEEAEKLAKTDLNSKIPFLLVQGGIAPIVYPIDNEFTKSYGVYYYELGCTGPEREISVAYNNIIFKYLCDTYGKKWKKIIRKDVIGLKEFKKKNSH